MATLEMLVNLADRTLLTHYRMASAEFEDSLVETVTPRRLPTDWRTMPAGTATRDFGTRWAEEQRSVILKVPSAVIPMEFNYLLNPRHPDFAQVDLGQSRVYPTDMRLTD